MPLIVDKPQDSHLATAADREMLEVALLNNLGDGGLESGERQFTEMLQEASGSEPVRLRLFSLPGIPRGQATQARIAARYTDFADLMQSRVDGLIVTGCEPVATRLPEEPVWTALTEVIDWAEHNTRSTIWSCLAAHAAVLHLDGIERKRLARKCSGLFTLERMQAHPLLDGVSEPLVVPHSRWNGLDEAALAAAGYEIVTRSAEVGVDLFVKRWRSLFVYLQGHPEYDEGALRSEYRRDVLRFLAGTASNYPEVPRHYFTADIESSLHEFEVLAKRDPATRTAFPLQSGIVNIGQRNRELTVGLFRNWLRELRTTSLERVLQPGEPRL